jgi:CRP-like cAMP-binding protein
MSIKADLSGNLGFLGLVELLQLLGANGSSGTLRLQSKYAAGPAVVYFSNGNPVDASSESLKGLDALYSLFGWTEGEFEFRKDAIERTKAIQNSRMEVILDGLKKLDDGQIKKLGPQTLVQTADSGKKGVGIPVIKGPLIDYNFVVDEEEYTAGTPIVEEGKHGNWIWVVLEGAVDIVKQTPQGPLTIVKISEGTFIGSMASFLLEGNIRSASAIAATNVQLGVIDSQRVSNEYARLSSEFKGFLKSLDNRMIQVSDRVVDFHLKSNKLKAYIQSMEPILKQGDKKEKLFVITAGKACVVRTSDKANVPLVSLGREDYFGYHPFLDLGHEPYSASIVGSENLTVKEVNLAKIHKEYDQLSSTVKHLIENIAANISITTLVATDLFKKMK